jgi:hypothetical protein
MKDTDWNVGTMKYRNVGFKGKIPDLKQYSNAPILQ